MRKDSPDLTAGPDDSPIDDRRSKSKSGSRLAAALPILVWGLVFGTSAAVASLSWWLVVPYLAVMGFLLFEPAGRRVNATNPAGPESASSGDSSLDDASDPVEAASENPEESEVSGEPSSSDASSRTATAPKARRAGKGRAKKSRNVVEPAPATWVQVAPGKFVRVEPGSLPAEPGPHPSQPEGEPVAVPLAAPEQATPSDVEPARPLADAGPQDVPLEVALETPHPDESTPTPRHDWPDGSRHLIDVAEAPLDDSPDDPCSFDVSPTTVDDPSCLAVEAQVIAAEGSLLPDAPEPEPLDVADDPDARAEDDVIDVPTNEFNEADDPEAVAVPDHSEGDEPDERAGDSDTIGEPAEETIAVATVDLDLPPADHDEAEAEGDEPDARAESIAERDDEFATEDSDEPAVGDEPIADRSSLAAFEGTDVSWESDREPRPASSGTSRPRGDAAQGQSTGGPPSWRNIRTARADRLPSGYRRRSRRGDGRPHHFVRAFPPRSPPARGVVPV